MEKNLDKIIQEADALIKQGKYAEAWKLLLPYKDDGNARKRLKWLKAKQDETKLAKEIAAAPVRMTDKNWFNRLSWPLRIGIMFLGVCCGCFSFFVVGQSLGFIPDSTELASTNVTQATDTVTILTQNAPTLTATEIPNKTSIVAPTPSATFTASASPTIANTPASSATNTPAPPTATYALHNPDDLCPIEEVEAQLLEMLANTEGVDFVESLCIQNLGGEVYFSADIIVYQGYNTVEIPEMLYAVISDKLTTKFDTLINMSDGLAATAYSWNPDGEQSIVPYTTGVIPPTPRPR